MMAYREGVVDHIDSSGGDRNAVRGVRLHDV